MQATRSRQLRLPALLLLCLAPAGPALSDGLGERCALLEERLPEMIERAGVPGISVAILGPAGFQWSQAIGQRDAQGGAPVDAQTVFEAASLSKPVFAYLLLKLVDEELLELDTPLVDYAPLHDIAHDPRHRQLTARLLLSHSGGLPNWRPNGGKLEFLVDPGSRWSYSGEGFVLLQGVLEELSGDSLQNLAQSLVFRPLGMTRSSFIWKPEFAANLALPHGAGGHTRPKTQSERANAAASLMTTAEDYARFLGALLRGDGLSKSSLAALQVPTAKVNEQVSWGLGVGLEENPDGLALWHWGHNSGYRAYTISYPARELAVVYFTNSDNGMLLLADLIGAATGEEEHPAIRHLDYASYTKAPKAE